MVEEKENQQEPGNVLKIEENPERERARVIGIRKQISSEPKNISQSLPSIQQFYDKGTDMIKVGLGMKEAVNPEALDDYNKRINVLSEVIRKIVGQHKTLETLLLDKKSTVDEFLNAIKDFDNSPGSPEEDNIKTYQEIIERLTQLGELETQIKILEEEIEISDETIEILEENERELSDKLLAKTIKNESLEKELRKLKKKHQEEVQKLNKEIQDLVGTSLAFLESKDQEIGDCSLFYKEKMFDWLKSDLKKVGNGLRNKFDSLGQLLEKDKESRTGQRWQNLFKLFDAYYQTLENFTDEEQQVQLENKEKDLFDRQKELESKKTQLESKKTQLKSEIKDLQWQISNLKTELKELELKKKEFTDVQIVERKELKSRIDSLEANLSKKNELAISIKEQLEEIKEKLIKVNLERDSLYAKNKEIHERKKERESSRSARFLQRLADPQKEESSLRARESWKKIEKSGSINYQISQINICKNQLQGEQIELENNLENLEIDKNNIQEKLIKSEIQLKEKDSLINKLLNKNKLHEKKSDLIRLIGSTKLKISEKDLKYCLVTYQQAQEEVISNTSNTFAKNQLKIAEEKLIKELTKEGLEAILTGTQKLKEIDEQLVFLSNQEQIQEQI